MSGKSLTWPSEDVATTSFASRAVHSLQGQFVNVLPVHFALRFAAEVRALHAIEDGRVAIKSHLR